MSKMNKVVITEFGDESKLAIVEDDFPDPAAGEVQLSVEYSIVSGSDVNMRRGTYPFQRKAPLTPGYSVLGKVRVNGKGCTKFTVGDRVACLSKYDGQAELINLPERFLVRVPDGIDLKAHSLRPFVFEIRPDLADCESVGRHFHQHSKGRLIGPALLQLVRHWQKVRPDPEQIDLAPALVLKRGLQGILISLNALAD